mmetsp:Transcript_53925/g.128447  ORF Transcript_53925/g.128447 Transcript_53925/m.128447 type:complete len:584 (+) Transcript_53925:61-1812(+)
MTAPPGTGTVGSRSTGGFPPPRKRDDKKPMHALVQLVEKRLRDADSGVREAVVEALPQLYAPNDQLMDVSCQLLEHEDWYARRGAAKALARLADLGGAVDVAHEVGPRLDHHDAETRRCAALTMIGLADKAEDVKAIVGALPKGPSTEESSTDADAQANIQALISGNASPELLAAAAQKAAAQPTISSSPTGELGEGEPDMTLIDGAEVAAKEVSSRFHHDARDVRLNAVRTLSRMQSSAVGQAAKLGSCVSDSDCMVRAATVKAFDELGSHAVHGAVEAAVGLDSEEHVTRLSAQRVLLTLAKYEPKTAAAAAAHHLRCPLPQGRVAAADTLARIGHAAADHGKELIARLEDDDIVVRRTAVRAIIEAGPGMLRYIQLLVNLLQHPSPDIARLAVAVIRGLGPQEAKIVEAVAQPLHEELEGDERENATLRKQVVEILGGAGENAIPYLGDIVKELEDNEWSVRRAAVEALDDLGAHAASAAASVARRLVHNEAEVRRAAAEAIGRMGIHAGRYRNRVEVLMDTEEDLDVRIACQRAVEAQREVSRALRRPSGSTAVPQAITEEHVQQERAQPKKIIRRHRK